MKGRKKGEYNLHYGKDERKVHYATCNYWEVPVYPTLMELWDGMMSYMTKQKEIQEHQKEIALRVLEKKRKCPSYGKQYRKTNGQENNGFS